MVTMSASSKRTRGFTLIELMIVISIILILMSVGLPLYQQSVLRAREGVLRENLYTMRQQIQAFTLDKQRAPQSLEDLVGGGYLREIPIDPITNSRETWIVEQEDSLMSVDQTQPGVVDVRSGSENSSSQGTPHSSW